MHFSEYNGEVFKERTGRTVLILLRGNVAGDRQTQTIGRLRETFAQQLERCSVDKINGEVFFVIPCYQLSANTLIKARNSLFSRGSIYVLLCVKFLPISCLKKLTCKNFFLALIYCIYFTII